MNSTVRVVTASMGEQWGVVSLEDRVGKWGKMGEEEARLRMCWCTLPQWVGRTCGWCDVRQASYLQ